MSQFTKNLELDVVLASGVSTGGLQRDTSTHFDQRRVVSNSGVVVDTQTSREYVADGFYSISDYYPLTLNATGILQVNIRNINSVGNVAILNSAGSLVMEAKPSKLSSRNNAVTTTTINASGAHYMYVALKGRSGCEYRVGVDVY